MEKKTFVPERKAYLAPAAKSHLIAIEVNFMASDLTDQFEEEDDDIFVE